MLVVVAESEKSPVDLKAEVEDLRIRLGSDDPQTVRATLALVRAYQHSDDHKSAIRTSEELLEICKRVFGDEDPKTLNAMAFLAFSYTKTGSFDKARAIKEQLV